MGEGLSPDESREATFVLTGVGTWVGKPPYLAAGPLTIQEGWQEIAQAVTECWVKVRDPGHLCVNPLTPQPFIFDQWGDSPQKDTPKVDNSDHKLLPQQPPRGWHHNRHRTDQGLLPPQPPLPSYDCRFESDRSFGVEHLINVITVRQVGRLPVFVER